MTRLSKCNAASFLIERRCCFGSTLYLSGIGARPDSLFNASPAMHSERVSSRSDMLPRVWPGVRMMRRPSCVCPSSNRMSTGVPGCDCGPDGPSYTRLREMKSASTREEATFAAEPCLIAASPLT